MRQKRLKKKIFHHAIIIGLCSVFILSTQAHADTGSSSWLKWRTTAPTNLCNAKPNSVNLGVGISTNYLVRGIGVFHRPLDDFLAQKMAVIPELRWQYTKNTEFVWDSAIAIQARELTRLEIRHAESVQNFRVHHCIDFAEKWALLAGGNMAVSLQDSGGLRSEAALSLLRRITNLTLELGVLQHQAIFGDSPSEWSFTHAHFEVFDDHHSGKWEVLPYVRVSGEKKSFDWDQKGAFSLQMGIRGAYFLETAPLIWTWSTDFIQRIDLNEYTINLSFGAQWDFTRH